MRRSTTGLILFISVLQATTASAQMKWDGGGGNDQWVDPLNWVGDSLPAGETDVILDHTFIREKYRVVLPSGNTSVILKRIRIDGGADSIILLLPPSNTAAPALVLSGAGYGLHIGKNAVFINASGASSGQPLQVADSIRIDNEGRFVHQTARSHAANVTVMSKAAGTEKGVFQFDIPDASATISLSDRTFGTLQLSASVAKGKINYTASGTRKIHVRGDLIVDTGVTVSLNFSDTFFVDGDFIQHGGTFNCATSSRALVIAIAGNFIQFSSGIITESGTAGPSVLLNGTNFQLIRQEGKITNSVIVSVRNNGGRLLTSLSIPYKIKLMSGIIQTADTALLILLAGGEIVTDSTMSTSYIEGPVQKIGMDSTYGFLFPVGKNGVQRWIRVNQFSGDMLVEFIRENPQILSGTIGSGLHHISSLEYWKIKGDPMLNSRIELSFDNVNSGGVTELSSLRVAQLAEGQWKDAGNAATTGNAGSSGSVVSDLLTNSESETRYFTLAAATSQNPLPDYTFELSGEAEDNSHVIEWIYQSDVEPLYFFFESSIDNFFTYDQKIVAKVPGQTRFRYRNDEAYNNSHIYYRIRVDLPSGRSHFSRIIMLHALSPIFKLRGVRGDDVFVEITGKEKNQCYLQVTDFNGRVLQRRKEVLAAGLNVIGVNIKNYGRGIYYLTVFHEQQRKVFPVVR